MVVEEDCIVVVGEVRFVSVPEEFEEKVLGAMISLGSLDKVPYGVALSHFPFGLVAGYEAFLPGP